MWKHTSIPRPGDKKVEAHGGQLSLAGRAARRWRDYGTMSNAVNPGAIATGLQKPAD
jgi:NAD(P)-dependent dehydrogenase (short-subunit alcohol dehydrogenase family)